MNEHPSSRPLSAPLRFPTWLFLLATLWAGVALHGAESFPASEKEPAVVVVTDDVVAADPQPFGLNQLNFKWGCPWMATGLNTGFESARLRERFVVTSSGTTADNRTWFTAADMNSSSYADGLWIGAAARIYRLTTGADNVKTWQRIAQSTVQEARLGRTWYRVSFGLNESLSATASRPGGGSVTVSFRYVMPGATRDFTDGRSNEWYQQSDLQNNRTYYYSVMAIDSGGNWSAFSAPASATPNAGAAETGPRILTHQIGRINNGATSWEGVIESTDGQGALTWSVVGSLPGALLSQTVVRNERTKLRIYLPTGSTAGAAESALSTITVRVTDSAVPAHADERTIVLNPVPPTLIGSDVTAPEPPVNLVATPMNGAVRLTWEASPSPDVIGYLVYRSLYAPEVQDSRLELADTVTLQANDIVTLDAVHPDLTPDLYRETSLFSFYEGDRLWPNWQAPGGPRLDWRSGRNLGYDPNFHLDYVPHPTPVPPEMSLAGSQCVRASAPAGWFFSFGLFNHNYSAAEQFFYKAPEPGKKYRLILWVRQQGVPNGTIVIRDSHLAAWNRTFTVAENTWTKLQIDDWTMSAIDTNVSVNTIKLEVSGGGTVWADQAMFYEVIDVNNDGLEDITPFEFTPYWRQQLTDFFTTPNPNGPRPVFRYWGTQNNGERGARLDDALANPMVRSRGVNGDNMSLPVFLETCRQTKADPWIIVSVTFPEEEWANLIDYLAGGVETVYGARRIADRGGIATPWTTEFGKLYLECDNETWNGAFSWAFPAFNGLSSAAVYGAWAETMFRAAKAAPSWIAQPSLLDGKVRFIVNGWSNQTSTSGYGAVAATAAPSADLADTAPYLGGWESGTYIGGSTLTDDGFSRWLVYGPWSHYPNVNQHTQSRITLSAGRAKPYLLAVYEGGPGYDLPGPSNPSGTVAESYGKSLAAALTTLDCYLHETYRGYGPQAFFGFAPGTRWTTHSIGLNTANTAVEFRPQGTWLAQQLRNNYASGPMLQTFLSSAPTRDLPAQAGNPAAPATPLLATYAFRDGDRYSVMLLSRRLDLHDAGGNISERAITPVTLRLPFRSATSLSLHRILNDPRRCNVPGMPYFQADNLLAIENLPLDASLVSDTFPIDGSVGGFVSADGTVTGLPAGGLYLYVFEGTQSTPPPAQPQVSIQRAAGQPATTFGSDATFTVIFDRAVTGFAQQDLDFSTSTVNLSNAVITLTPLDAMLVNPLAWTVSIKGLLGSGLLRLNLPAGAVTALTGGVTNAAVSGESAQVRRVGVESFIDFDPHRATWIDYREINRPRQGATPEVEVYLPYDLTNALFADYGGQQKFYGGVRAMRRSGANPTGSSVLSSVRYANLEGTTRYPQDSIVFVATNGASGQIVDCWMLFMWKKEDFLTEDKVSPFALNSGSQLFLNIVAWASWGGENQRIRYLIRDGTQYFLSQNFVSAAGNFDLTSFVNSSDHGWAPVSITEGTTDFSTVINGADALAYGPRSFADVQAVGFLAKGIRGYSSGYSWDRFIATRATDTKPYFAFDLASSLAHVRNGVVRLSATAVDGDSSSLTYTWNVQAPAGANPAFSTGPSLTIAAGLTAETVVTFDQDGWYTFQVSASDGLHSVLSQPVGLLVGNYSFDAWQQSLGVSGSPADDNNQDGFPLLLEYALGLDPNVFNRTLLPGPSPTPGLLELVFNRYLNRGDLLLRLETSSDGVSWIPAASQLLAGESLQSILAGYTVSETPAGNKVEVRIAFTPPSLYPILLRLAAQTP